MRPSGPVWESPDPDSPGCRACTASGTLRAMAVQTSAATKNKVFARCKAITRARAADESPATRRCKTRTAPTPASPTINPKAQPAARLCSDLNRPEAIKRDPLRTKKNSEATISRDSPLVMRWENSIHVAVEGAKAPIAEPAEGKIWPLQRGQWLPHPAPDPEARTNAPHTITKIT